METFYEVVGRIASWLLSYKSLAVSGVVAVCSLALKEAIEWRRRKRAERRKRTAIHALLANECERNQKIVAGLREVVRDVKIFGKQARIELSGKKTGSPLNISIWDENREVGTTIVIPSIHKVQFERLLLEAAMLDEGLFSRVLNAYQALADIETACERLRFYIEEHGGQLDQWREPIAAQTAQDANSILAALNLLYRECTGKELANHQHASTLVD